MALSNPERLDITRKFIQKIFVESNATANLNLDDIKAAVDSVDDTLDTLASGLTQGQSVLLNFNARLPEPFKSTATLAQKSIVLAYVALKRGGIL